MSILLTCSKIAQLIYYPPFNCSYRLDGEFHSATVDWATLCNPNIPYAMIWSFIRSSSSKFINLYVNLLVAWGLQRTTCLDLTALTDLVNYRSNFKLNKAQINMLVRSESIHAFWCWNQTRAGFSFCLFH